MNVKFKSFSKKQMAALTWWCPQSPYAGHDAIICDGAVRSGKTLCMCISFVSWALTNFEDAAFALCGKSVRSLRRNVTVPILPILQELGFECREKLGQNMVEIAWGGHRGRFYLFGGRDESSASLIQGITLGGVLLDEVALMPRSFVEQALARCSLEGAKFWFNCNPENPMHWFYLEWIKKAKEKNCLYLHFTMRDNPSLSPKVISRYEKLYSGAFYERFVLGKWVAVQGCVYPFFSRESHVALPPAYRAEAHVISCDYGTVNPSSFGLWGRYGRVWYRLAEYYHDSRLAQEQRTDEEHYRGLCDLAGELEPEAVIVDPSAASFIQCISRHGRFKALPAQNDVLDGIRRVGDALKEGLIKISPACSDCLREFGLYRWEENSREDRPRKEHDHTMDDIRYFVSTYLRPEEGGFFALSTARGDF